jgi:hypothetical protein
MKIACPVLSAGADSGGTDGRSTAVKISMRSLMRRLGLTGRGMARAKGGRRQVRGEPDIAGGIAVAGLVGIMLAVLV